MKRRSMLCAALALCLALACALPAGAAQTNEAEQTVRGNMWSGGFIYVDNIPVYFLDEDGKEVYAVIYDGSVYIPLQSAGEWLGGTSAWDEASQTVILTRGENPVYYNTNDGLPDLPGGERWVQIQQYRQDVEDGIDLTLLPEATVLLDGEEITFTNVHGTPLCPLLFRGMIYLPVRSLGELCGKQVLWFTGLTASMYQPERLEDLHPRMPTMADQSPLPYVLLYDALTPEEEEAAQAYLEQAEALFAQLLEGTIALRDAGEDVSQEKNLASLQAAAAGLCSLESPHPVLQDMVCRYVDYRGELIGGYIARELPAFLGEEGSGTPPSAYSFAFYMADELYQLRRTIDLGWELLEAVQAQAAAPSAPSPGAGAR